MFREREASSFWCCPSLWSGRGFGLRGAVAVARCTRLEVLAFRGFPAVAARRRFYLPSPSGRPLNVDPRVCANSRRVRAAAGATGKEADFLALDAKAPARVSRAVHSARQDLSVRQGGYFEAKGRHKPGYPELKTT